MIAQLQDKYIMKVAITGHTRGIGAAIFHELVQRNHSVIGYSLTSGFDIGQEACRQQILSEAADCDVFVNNAFYPDAQFQLLQMFVNQWEGLDKVIVNVNSKSIFAPVVPDSMKLYVEDKKTQNQFIQQRKFKACPQIVNLILGLVETEMSQMFVAKKLQPTHIAKLLVDILEQRNQIYVQDLILDVPFQDWISIQHNDK
jgi:hypothetical protein